MMDTTTSNSRENKPLVSVIVPLYNGSKYITSCLDSLIIQNYVNFEVIVVNDGSTDNSLSICYQYISTHNDTRFSVVSKTNGGLSDARNYGLSHCSEDSEYVVFVDSDDELTPDCLSLLMANASHNAMVVGTLLRCYKNNIPPINDLSEQGIILNNIWDNQEFLSRLKDGIINSCCGNCYSLRVIRNNNLKFKKLLPEDTFFNFDYLSVITDVVLIERPIYYYFIWGNTMSTNPKEEIYTNYMTLQQLLYDKVNIVDQSYIDCFVYPQYRVNSMNFIHKGELALPNKYLGMGLIKKSIESYYPVSIADRILHFCLKNRLLKIARLF